MSVRRGCTNGNARGGSQDRARRRRWLIDTFGDGTTAPCALATPACTGPVTVDTVTADRIIPGCDGGTYRRDNIQPACQPCQSRQGGQLGAQRARQNESARRARHQTHS